MTIPEAPKGTPKPVTMPSNAHKVTSVPSIWHKYALPSDVAVEPVKERR